MRNGLNDFIQKSLVKVDVGLFNVEQLPEFVHVMPDLCEDTITNEVFFEEIFHLHIFKSNSTLWRQVLCIK